MDWGYDAVYNDSFMNIHHKLNIVVKVFIEVRKRIWPGPDKYAYKDAVKYMVGESSKDVREIPVISPNWDHTPRSGKMVLCSMIVTQNILKGW